MTVHVAIGTDTPHTHPAADGAAIGEASLRDFRLFAALAADLDSGGVYLNVGSAVLLPEVFLKAVAAVRNLGHPLSGFTTANFDFLQHYRPARERGGTAARAIDGKRLRHHRASRADDSAAGGGPDRKRWIAPNP